MIPLFSLCKNVSHPLFLTIIQFFKITILLRVDESITILIEFFCTHTDTATI